MNTQHSRIKAGTAEQGERRQGKRAYGSNLCRQFSTIALGILVVGALFVTTPASAVQADPQLCPPERIIIWDGVAMCNEAIGVVDVDTPPYNLRWNLPDARGGGVPTYDGYLPSARVRTSNGTRSHHPTKRSPKIKVDKKITDLVTGSCNIPGNRQFQRPFFNTPTAANPNFVCTFQFKGSSESYINYYRYIYDVTGHITEVWLRPVTRDEGQTFPIPPGTIMDWRMFP